MEEDHPIEWALRRRAHLSRGVVAWDVFGAGPPVVLAHGTPSWSSLWPNVVPTFPGSRVRIIQDAGHFSMEDIPAEVAGSLLEFFWG